MLKLVLFDTKSYDKDSFELVKQDDISITYLDSKLNKDTVSLAKGFDAVCAFVNDTIDKEVIDKLYSYGIDVILLRCAGFNNVDLRAAYKKIHIYRVPAYSPYAVAEHAFALLLTSNRRIHKAYNRTREYNFSLDGLTGIDLYGKTIGIIGTGKIGQVMINIAKGFGMNVIAYDPFPNSSLNINYVSLDKIYEESDVISLHCPLTKENNHLINKTSIEKMKKGVFIVNTSRGGLINSKDLYEGLKSRKIGAAVLDVYEEESSIFFENKSNHILDDETLSLLISLPNVIVTSHQAFLTKEALTNIATTTIENLRNHYKKINNTNNELCYLCGNQGKCLKERNGKCF